MLRLVVISIVVFGMTAAVSLAGDVSKYRDFQLGTNLAAVTVQVGASPSQAKVIHNRPALIQELDWRPQPLGAVSKTEPVKEVVFSFYNGALYRIVIDYDRYQTEGLTAGDMVEAISATYGIAEKPTASAKTEQERSGDQEEILARWQDSGYRFELMRSAYGQSFRLIGTLKKLEVSAQAASIEAARLDDQEAPQREAARMASEKETERAKLEKSRLVNKPNFRP